MSRRSLARVLGALGLLTAATAVPLRAARAQGPALSEEAWPFSFERLIDQARLQAQQAYAPPPPPPDIVAELPFDQYRAIRYRPEHAIWAGSPSYQLQPFHLGSHFRQPVRLHLVTDGTARRILYHPDLFDFGGNPIREALPAGLDFSGFGVHYPLHGPDRLDELLAFQGASYFRALGKGTRYGLSARGLALNTGLGRPEEFPAFTDFWIVRPNEPFDPLTIYALLDSPSVVGAYRFDVAARDRTFMSVDTSLFFRADVEQVGIAPLTSMYYFGSNDRAGIDDWRPAVHNSGGLSVWRGGGELVWRPLTNPAALRISVFADDNPRGFGLLQRDRAFDSYQDLQNRYDLRPNLWVAPKGAWGSGSVRLIEIPTPDESHDNIVAFWTPASAVTAGQELRFAYDLVWSLPPPLAPGTAEVAATLVGAASRSVDGDLRTQSRHVEIEFGATPTANGQAEVRPEVLLECRNGTCSEALLLRNEVTGGWRVSFEVAAQGRGPIEMRCYLTQGGDRLSETWLYRTDDT
ncbi:MAG TPA: glucan biosynthesis protein [Geminicoccaceae bacterium]|nr:glucan biosynthesis protein [Geminicoccaceae bacterium]